MTGGQLLAVNEDSSLSFHNIEVRNGANLLIGGGSRIDADGTVRVTGNSKIILKGKNAAGQVGGQWVGQGVTLFAYNVQLDNGSSITADGQGYTGGAVGQPGQRPRRRRWRHRRLWQRGRQPWRPGTKHNVLQRRTDVRDQGNTDGSWLGWRWCRQFCRRQRGRRYPADCSPDAYH